jgi:hypothetical protein
LNTPDRTSDISEICSIFSSLSKKDLRIGQILEIIRSNSSDKDLFSVENDKFLSLLKDLEYRIS